MPGPRKVLDHVPPSAVRNRAWYFITICCEHRGVDQLCRPEITPGLLEDAVFYHTTRRWNLHLFLLMPDHLHMIAGFPHIENISEVIRSWKRLTARRLEIDWQRNYFDYRVRLDEGLEQKSDYIRQNPVRAGLVERTEDWPYFVDYRSLESRWGQRPLPKM
jgi:putative transposase